MSSFSIKPDNLNEKSPTTDPNKDVKAGRVNPQDPTQAFYLFGTGEIRGVNLDGFPADLTGTGVGSNVVPPRFTEVAVDFVVTVWAGDAGPGGYIFTNHGRVVAFGSETPWDVANFCGDGLTPDGRIQLVAFHKKEGVQGGWAINNLGRVYAFGVGALAIVLTAAHIRETTWDDKSCVDWSFSPDPSMWLALGADGSIKSSPSAAAVDKSCTAFDALSLSRTAVAIEYDWARQTGYVLDSHGTSYPIGKAPQLPADPYWPQVGYAADLVMGNWGDTGVFSYWIFDYAGGTYYRTVTTPPRVAITSPVGLPLIQHLVANPAKDGVFRLRRLTSSGFASANLVSKQIAYKSTIESLATVLDDFLGVGAYSITLAEGYVDGAGLDVYLSLVGGNADALALSADSLNGVSLTTSQEGGAVVLTDTARPTITWTYADSEGDNQGDWEVQVWPLVANMANTPPTRSRLNQPVWEASGSGRYVRSVKVSKILANNQSYRVFVRASEQGGLTSDWDWSDFSLSLVLPIVPSATLAADPSLAAISIDLSGTTAAERTLRVWLERKASTAVTWDVVRGSGSTLTDGLYDDFERSDNFDIGAFWTTDGDVPLRLRGGAIEPDGNVIELKVNRLTAVGAESPIIAAAIDKTTMDRNTPSWAYQRSWPLANGGPQFYDGFSVDSPPRLSNGHDPNLPSGPDGSVWEAIAGEYRAEGGFVVVPNTSHKFNLNRLSIAAVDTGSMVGAARLTVLENVAGSITTASYGAIGLYLSGDRAGTGLVLYGYITGGHLVFRLGRINTANRVPSIIASYNGTDYNTGAAWQPHTMCVRVTPTMVYLDVLDLDGELIGSKTWAASAVNPTYGTYWGLFRTKDPTAAIPGDITANLMKVDDFRWARDGFSIPGTSSQNAIWMTDESGVAFPALPGVAAGLSFATEPDTSFSIATGADGFNGVLKCRSGADPEVSVQITRSGGSLVIGDGTAWHAIIDGATVTPLTESLTVQVYENTLSVLIDGVHRQITPWMSDHPVGGTVDDAEWNVIGGTGTLAEVAPDLKFTVSGADARLESDDFAVPTGHAGWSASNYIDMKGITGTFGQAYIAYVDDGVITLLSLGPKRPFTTGSTVRLAVAGVVPGGTTHLRYGVLISSATNGQEFLLTDTGRIGLDSIAIPDTYRSGTFWHLVGAPLAGFKSLAIEPVGDHTAGALGDYTGANGVSAPGTELSTHQAGGRANSVADLPVASDLDAIIMNWGLSTDDVGDLRNAVDAAVTWTRLRSRNWFINTFVSPVGSWDVGGWPTVPAQRVLDAQGAIFEPSGRVVTSSDDGATLKISIPKIGLAERLAIGITLTGADNGFSYKRPTDAEWIPATDAWGDSFANRASADGHYATAAVAHISMEANDLPQDLELRCDDGITFDWWGIESDTSSCRTVLLGIQVTDPPGDETDRNTALSEVADLYEEVEFVPVLPTDLVDDVPSVSLLGSLTDVFSGFSADRGCDATAFYEHEVPGAEVTASGPCAVFAGTDSILAPTKGRKLVVTTNPLGHAWLRTMSPVSGSWAYDDVVSHQTVSEIGDPRTVALRLQDDGVTPVPTGDRFLEVWLDGVKVATLSDAAAPDGEINGVQLRSFSTRVDSALMGGGVTTFRDYEGRPGVIYTYRIRTSSYNGEVFAEPVELGSVTTPQVGYWLKDPLNPERNMRVQVDADDFGFVVSEEQGVFEIPGRSRAIVVSGALKAPKIAGQSFSVTSEEELANLMTLLKGRRTLLFQSQRGRQFYVRFGPEMSVTSIMDSFGRAMYQVSVPDGVSVDEP